LNQKKHQRGEEKREKGETQERREGKSSRVKTPEYNFIKGVENTAGHWPEEKATIGKATIEGEGES